ncbi:hypothetical protein KKE06_00965 [Candidatus Micrarchaeota archaeon]|nr:hypothetical protein [Candidatus Micrarchaeota archaeon]MBU1929875.1 hypothetical protein [Candidatus Micrarchaeota archaeon]
MTFKREWGETQKLGFVLLILAIAIGLALFFYYSIWLMALGIVFFVAGLLLLATKKSTLKKILMEKRKINDQISNAEKKFLNREMTEQSFQEFKYKKQKELIGIESRLQALQDQQNVEKSKEMREITSKKKHVLKELLLQKEALLAEFKISEKKYLKRELGEKEFFDIQHSVQERLLELDSEIKNFYSAENVGPIMGKLDHQLKDAKKAKQQKKQFLLDEMVGELSEQSKRKRN